MQPAASAGATFIAKLKVGMFHGMMAATGPIGCLKVMLTNPGVLRLVSPLAVNPASALCSNKVAAK